MTNIDGKDFLGGEVLFFDKPFEWTSFALVKKVRWLISKKIGVKKIKVGHAGTLDPLATGLMILCTGKATKRINEFMEYDKEYVATIQIGATTPSFDLETEISEPCDYSHVTHKVIEEELKSFVGEQLQEPPAFSAVNVNGKRAYSYARAGQSVNINKKLINIKDIKLIECNIPSIIVRIKCSKGTYVRSIVRDLGERLKCGAYLKGLVRTKIGEYSIEEALRIEEFEKLLNN
jgi:tRNA pseudouridine55 synthase